jgi:hypothetical protein
MRFLPNVVFFVITNLYNVVNGFNFHDFISLGTREKITIPQNETTLNATTVLIPFNNTNINTTVVNYSLNDTYVEHKNWIVMNNMNLTTIIGVLTDPKDSFNLTAVDANYIYWLNSGAAEVLPIFSNSTNQEIDMLLSKINGIIIPDRYEPLLINNDPTVKYLIQKIIEKNTKENTYLPLLGIGSGANLLLATIGNDFNMIDYIQDSYNVMRNVEIVTDPVNLLSNFDWLSYTFINSNPTTAHFVKEGISPDKIANNTALNDLIKVTGTSSNHKNMTYISMFEGKSIPIYGMLFHPEKMPWDKNEDKEHKLIYNSYSTIISQNFLNFLVFECKKNENRFLKEDKLELINIKEHKPFKRNGRYYFYFGVDNANINKLKYIQAENLKILENIPMNDNKILFSFKESGKDRNGNEIKPVKNLRQTFFSVSMKP